jgi:transposase-like protein
MGNRKTYSEEFKLETLRLLESSGSPVAQLERELGLSHGLLRNWRKRYQVNKDNGALERSEGEQLQAEIRRLQRENAVLRQEREILKKAVQIFSQEKPV